MRDSWSVTVCTRLVLLDACTLENFAVVDALWVLEKRYGDDAAWTEAVRHEIRRGVRTKPVLQQVLDLESTWLGAPYRLDHPGDEEVDLIRRGLGGTNARPLDHLGEAESIRLLERTRAAYRVFLTDDGPAADFARRRSTGLTIMTAADVLADAYSLGDIGCPHAYEMLLAMAEQGRAVHIPHHRDVC